MINKLLAQLNDRWIAHRLMGDDYGSKLKAFQLTATFHTVLFLMVGPLTYFPALLLSRRLKDRGWRWVIWLGVVWFACLLGCVLVFVAEYGPFAFLPVWVFSVPLCVHTAYTIERWRAIAQHFPAVTVEQQIAETTEKNAIKRQTYREKVDRVARVGGSPTDSTGIKLGIVEETVGDWSDAQGFKVDNEWLTVPAKLLFQHMLAIGAPNAGKSSLLLHLVKEALRLKFRVYVVDAKGSRGFAESCIRLMQEATGQPVPWFTLGLPGEGTRYNPFVGDKESICNRLLALMGVGVGLEGGQAYYADIKRNMVQLVCALTVEDVDAPRSLDELRQRLDLDWLRRTYAGHRVELAFITEIENHDYLSSLSPHVAQLVRAFNARTHVNGFTFDRERVGVLSINTLSLNDSGKQFFQMMVEDLCDWVSQRKERNEQTLVIVDEFGSLNTANVVRLLMQSREMATGVVLSSQVATFGSPQTNAAIMACTAIKVAMRSDDSEALSMTMGTYKTLHPTWQSNYVIKALGEENRYTGLGSGRPEDEFKAHPDEVARLRPGESYTSISRYVARLYTPLVDVGQKPLSIKRTNYQELAQQVTPSQGIEQEVSDLLEQFITR